MAGFEETLKLTPVEPDAFALEAVDWAELERNGVPTLDYLAEPFIPARKRIWAVGPSESGKSIWAAAKATALSRAGADVVYVSQENGLEEEARRFLRLRPSYERLRLYVDQGLDLTLVEHVGALLTIARTAALVVLDTLTACWSGDEDSNSELVAFDRDVLQPLRSSGTSVLVLDHTGNPPPGKRNRRSGVVAPRGASSKGQKTDFLLEFAAVGDGSFTLVRGKARGTHGATPYTFRLVDLDDGTLELAEAPTGTVADDVLALFVDGVVRTVSEIVEQTKHRRPAVEEALETCPDLAPFVDPKRVGRHANAKPWGTLDMHANIALSEYKENVLYTEKQVYKTDAENVLYTAVSLERDKTRDSGVHTTKRPRATAVCVTCGETFERGHGHKTKCPSCARPDLYG